jgi:hypothetical protein
MPSRDTIGHAQQRLPKLLAVAAALFNSLAAALPAPAVSGVVLVGPAGGSRGQIVLPAGPSWREAAAAAEIADMVHN